MGFLLAALGQVLKPAAVDAAVRDDCDPARRHRPQRRCPPPALERRHLAEDGAGPHLGRPSNISPGVATEEAHRSALHRSDGLLSTCSGADPDNLALDRRGNLAITEDPSTNPVGADIWVAAPPTSGRHQPASTVARFASLRDCEAEPTGIYFALKGTERYATGAARVTGESLLVNRQHAGLGTTNDQLIAITPTNEN